MVLLPAGAIMTETELLALLENKDARRAFFAMSSQDQRETFYDMLVFIRSQQAQRDKTIANIRSDIQALERAFRQVGRRADAPTLTTSQKIDVALSKTTFYVAWVWFRDKVLPNLVTSILLVVIMALLYTAFGGTIPSP